MKKTLLSALCAAVGTLTLMLGACGSSNGNGPLLTGTAQFQDPETDFAVNYLPENNLYQAQVINLKVDSTGHYTFDMDLPDGTADVEIFVGSEIYAAHLEEGKTTELNFVQDAEGNVSCTFSGDNADVSEAVTAAAIANDLFSLQGMPYAEAKALVDSRQEEAMKKTAAIEDDELRDYYTQLNEARYTGMKIRMLSDRALEENCKDRDYPEYQELIAKIDPNSDIDYIAMNSILWLMSKPQTEPTPQGDYSGYSIELMDLTDSIITHKLFRKQATYAIALSFFTYGDHETGKEEFWTRYKTFAKDYPEYIEAFQQEYEKVVVNMNGQKLPELTLTRPDGSTVSSLSLMGKYTYIDVWATWCGPCCKEIPFVEKLVEQMKDNARLQFVSISVDTDREAWRQKIEADKPAWAQYNLDDEMNKKLSDALAITGIPRFFILGPDGTIIDQDAKRPSDPELPTLLNELTK